MAVRKSQQEKEETRQLLQRDHSLNGGILLGLDGYIVEVQGAAYGGSASARAVRKCHDD